jgi:hypothetical protein
VKSIEASLVGQLVNVYLSHESCLLYLL